jgi:hypothetical protein
MNLGELSLKWIMHDILAVEYSSTGTGASIIVGEPGSGKRITVRSRDVPLFKICNSPDDMEVPTVADVFFAKWSGTDAYERLREAGWGLNDPHLPETIYQCHVEGGLVLDIFSCRPFLIEETRG